MASILSSFSSQYNELWKAIIRPPRDRYSIRDLGPMRFAIGKSIFKRSDFTLRNRRFQALHCSHFEPIENERQSESLPCVIYLHGNCSSRREALPYIPLLLPIGITVMAVDLSGSGLSDGDYISLGYHEKDDLSVLVEYLRNSKRCSSVGVWGRSMGAATALMYSGVDKGDGFLRGIVIDSSFCSLRQLCHELVHHYIPLLPNFLVDSALSFIKSTINDKAKVNIDDIAPIKAVGRCKVPALFISGTSDTLVNPNHSKTLHDNYGGEKMLMIIPGNHNSERPKFVKASIVIFFYSVFDCFNLPKSADALKSFINTDLSLLFNYDGLYCDENGRLPKPITQSFYAIQQYIRYKVTNNVPAPSLSSTLQKKSLGSGNEHLRREESLRSNSNESLSSQSQGKGIKMRPPDVDKYIDRMIPLSSESIKQPSSTIYSTGASCSRSTTFETISQGLERGDTMNTLSSFEEFKDTFSPTSHPIRPSGTECASEEKLTGPELGPEYLAGASHYQISPPTGIKYSTNNNSTTQQQQYYNQNQNIHQHSPPYHPFGFSQKGVIQTNGATGNEVGSLLLSTGCGPGPSTMSSVQHPVSAGEGVKKLNNASSLPKRVTNYNYPGS
ncbi:protein with a conserved N-terminal region [Cryptosporidium sp. chipmunk genotype I]|uniref:protein with a conserved N-terminal region n=1 Tax=Cryptosporidium sp. chipmunk genotype I TaxID=1280935 RepID=UPI00351A7E90|nr:protein with a conserved N-terminal region [Cryptosporidium sp. chipmunk genotype I]